MNRVVSQSDKCYKVNKPWVMQWRVADTALNQSAKEDFPEKQFLLTYGWYAGANQVNFCGKNNILGGEIVKVPRNSLPHSKHRCPVRLNSKEPERVV